MWTFPIIMKTNPLKNFFSRFLSQGGGGELPVQSASVFIRKLKRYLLPEAIFGEGIEIPTLAGNFQVDNLVEVNGRRIAVEYKESDTYDAKTDEWRDALLLGSGNIDDVYRFVGPDMVEFQDDCIYFISRFEPDIFNNAYPFKSSGVKYDDTERNVFFYNMVDDYGGGYRLKFILEHRRKADTNGNWNTLLNIAKANSNKTFDELMTMQAG
jgi:hypothetical protein